MRIVEIAVQTVGVLGAPLHSVMIAAEIVGRVASLFALPLVWLVISVAWTKVLTHV